MHTKEILNRRKFLNKVYRVYKKKCNLGISQEIHFVFISTKDFMPLGI